MSPTARTSISLCALALWLNGCGTGVDGKYEPPYGSLSGTITADGVTVPAAPIRVALLYWTNGGQLTPDRLYAPDMVAQEVAVEPTFPVQFKLDITTLPPASAVYGLGSAVPEDVDPTLRYATAFLVVYADNDRNGKLDLVDAGGQSPDTILASRPDLSILYLASGKPAPADYLGWLPTVAGFSVVRQDRGLDPTFDECDSVPNDDGKVFRDPCSSEAGPAELVANSDIVLALSTDPTLQDYACRQYVGEGDWSDHDLTDLRPCLDNPSCGEKCWGFGCGVIVEPPPPGVAIACSADNARYHWRSCQPRADLCGTNICHFGHGMLPPGTTPPADWPCPPK